MKVFQVIMSMLMLAALLVSGFVAWKTYQKMQKEELPAPIEKFEAYLKENNVNPFKIVGWSKSGDQTYIFSEIVTPDTTVTYQDVDVFMKLQTSSGEEWFHNDQETWRKVELKADKK